MIERSISIVVEWDNVRLAGASRSRAMLERLRSELDPGHGGRAEVLLVHDGRPGDVDEAKRILAPSEADVRVVPGPGLDYYELKNAGARAARGEIVVFLDCDIVPEPGWLREVLAPFADPAVAVVSGATYLEPSGFWGRSMALASVFQPRTESPGVVAIDRFFANNLAFRREAAIAFPFPAVAGTARASCVALSRQLAEAGVGVVANRAARASHPAPAGLRRTLARALVHGRDTVLLADAGIGEPITARAALRRLGAIVRSSAVDRRSLGLSPIAAPAAAAVALAYYGVAAAGAALARFAPNSARGLGL